MTETRADLDIINVLLIGDKDEIGDALKQIDYYFRAKIVEIIRKKALSANQHDLNEIYQEVLLSIYKTAQKGEYDPDAKRLERFIYTVTYSRTIDWIRKKRSLKRNCENEVLIESVAEAIQDHNIREAWELAQQSEQRSVILNTIKYLVPKLNLRQRQVAEIIIDNFPKTLSNSDIKEQILYKYNDDVSTAAVKSAKREVLKKVEASLIKSGYGDYVND